MLWEPRLGNVVQFVHALFMVEIWSLHKFFTWPFIFPYMPAYSCCCILIKYFLKSCFFLDAVVCSSICESKVEHNVGFSYYCVLIRKIVSCMTLMPRIFFCTLRCNSLIVNAIKTHCCKNASVVLPSFSR